MPTTLLSIGNDAKTRKGTKLNVLTAVQYLAPYTEAGVGNLCPYASAGCATACLFTAGRGKFDNVRQSRIDRTVLFMKDRQTYTTKLIFEIARHQRKAEKLGMIPAVRLNGTSDIKWESITIVINGVKVANNIMELYPEIRFYDYTKWPNSKRPKESLPSNYDLTFSRSETNDSQILDNLQNGRRVAIVGNTKKTATVPATFTALDGSVWPIIDGDTTDVRFNDQQGVVVWLRAKGDAKKDQSGFVVQVEAAQEVKA